MKIPANAMPRPRRFRGHWWFWFFEPCYRENVHVIWPVNEAQRRAFVNAHANGDRVHWNTPRPEDDDSWGGRAAEYEDSHVIALRAAPSPEALYGRLVHEVFHVTANVLTARGVEFVNERDAHNEPYAYLIESLFRTCRAAIVSVPRRPPPATPKRRRRKR
jgi:hypothetical protein